MKQMIALLLTLALLAALFCGCRDSRGLPGASGVPDTTEVTEPTPPPTPEEVLNSMRERMETVSSFALDTELCFEADVLNDGEQEHSAIKMNLSGELTLQPLALHSNGRVTVLDDGREESVPLELYFFYETGEEEAAVFCYFRTEEETDFQRFRIPMSDVAAAEETEQSTYSGLAWTMEESETGYVLSYTLTEADSQAINNAAEMQEQDEEAKEAMAYLNLEAEDFSKLLAGLGLRLSVDGATFELTQLELDLSQPARAVTEMILEALRAMLGENELPIAFEQLLLTVRFHFHDYDGVSSIEAPLNYEESYEVEDLLRMGNRKYTSTSMQTLQMEFPTEGWCVGDQSFDLNGLTLRDLTEHGWVIDTVYNETEMAGASEAEQALSEDGMLAPGTYVSVGLKPEGASDSACAQLELGLYANGKEPVFYLDCPIYAFSINGEAYEADNPEKYVDFTLPLDLRAGMTRAEIVEILGEPISTGTVPTPYMAYFFSGEEVLILVLDEADTLRIVSCQGLIPMRNYVLDQD